ncbi:MAG: hypothetical protein QOE17_1933 [Gaiellales bacterium]|nr:hypothetical protein [Gaiellales bacterium]
MTPSELTASVARANDRIRSALTGATSLAALAIVAVAGCYGVHRIQPALAEPMAVLALGGVLALAIASRVFSWQRDENYDDIVLAGFRHDQPAAVARRARQLVSISDRRRFADTLDGFVIAAVKRRPTPVPVHRDALIELQPKVQLIATILRRDDLDLEPAGMVLLRRLVTDGTTSPLFRPTAQPSELERELERIRRVLGVDDEQQLAA